MKKVKFAVIALFALALALVLSAYLYFNRLYPYGPRSAFAPVLMVALGTYAYEHDGWFPKGAETSIDCLRLLHPNFIETEVLAGLSGNIQHTLELIKNNKPLTEEASSWVYFPGFRRGDPTDLAIVWERQEGLQFNGMLRNGHCVGFTDGSFKQIPSTKWTQFTNSQALLRERVKGSRQANKTEGPRG